MSGVFSFYVMAVTVSSVDDVAGEETFCSTSVKTLLCKSYLLSHGHTAWCSFVRFIT